MDFSPLSDPERGTLFAERYEIIEVLGRGGMGRVYRVEDKKLQEEVALKVINPEIAANKSIIERFRNELKLARQIAHRNVCKMYSLEEAGDRHFIVMEYVPGENLKSMIRMSGQMGLKTAITIAKQVAGGLNEAHRLGVIHRDLKPSNIMIDREGNARIMDFGIARLTKVKGITRAGTAVGTPEYMSPEQVEGRELDQRSDIYSLGVVLYEMVTGRVPFEGDTPVTIGVKQKTEMPADPKKLNARIPENFSRLILKCLEKDREKRYQNAGEVLRELERIEDQIPTPTKAEPGRKEMRRAFKKWPRPVRLPAVLTLIALLIIAGYLVFDLILKPKASKAPAEAVSLPTEKIVAVLPFDDLSPGKENTYFSEGLTEEIITDLSRLKTIRVFSRTSATILKGAKKDVQSIGKEFHVQYVLEGSVRKMDRDIRITVQLTDAATGLQVWAEKYGSTMEDVFKIQENLSRAIVDALKLKLTPEESRSIASRPLDNVLAYEFYLKARQEIWRWDKDALERALKFLQNGLDIVGENVLLYAGMGYVYWQFYNSGIRSDESCLRQVEEYAGRIFKLEPDSSYGHFLLGLYYTMGNNQKSVQHLKRVLEKDPNNADALFWLAAVYMHVGKAAAAAPLVDRLLKIDPLNPINHSLPGWLYFFNGQFELALEPFQRMLQMVPDDPAGRGLYAMTLIYNGRSEEAISLIDQLVQAEPNHLFSQLGLFLKYALQGRKQEALQSVTDELRFVAGRDITYSWFVAMGYTMLDEKEIAMDWLEKTVDLGFINYPLLSEYDPFLKKIRGEARFKKLMEKVKSEWERFVV
jgi:non-specific serine/threonine protein kinase